MEYAVRQAAAIALEGWEVHFLCKESFPRQRLATGIRVINFESGRETFWSTGKLRTIWRLTIGSRRISQQIFEIAEKVHFEFVLFACFKEYFSPFWVWPLRSLAKKGVVIGTIAHDPIRDFVVGPLWWHRWSVRLAYSFVSHVFAHDDTPIDFGGEKPDGIRIHQIPHGPYEVAAPKIGRLEMRRRLGFLTTKCTDIHEISKIIDSKIIGSTEEEAGQRLAGQAGASESCSLPSKLADSPVSESLIHSLDSFAFLPAASYSPLVTPASPDVVFLAFGQIRDGKNLDLFLRAMTQLPENVKLFVAGKGDSGSSKPPAFYQNLAQELGVADRCRWDVRRIPEDELGDIFAACDVVLLTYSAKFRSASGVLNAAVSARKPVLSSSGSGPLKTVVEKYHLGVFVEPDDLEKTLRGARMLLHSLSSPDTQNLDNRRSPLDSCFPFANSESTADTSGVQLPAWEQYERENSWKVNANAIMNLISASNRNA